MGLLRIPITKNNTLSSLKPDENYGFDPQLQVDRNHNSIFKVDDQLILSLLNTWIPHESCQAELTLFASYVSQRVEPVTFNFQKLSRDWLEGSGLYVSPGNWGSSWNSDGNSSWTGGSVSGPITQITPDYKGDIKQDITSWFTSSFSHSNHWNSSNTNFGWRLSLSDNTNESIFNFYGVKTHTIYYPYIDITWDDVYIKHPLDVCEDPITVEVNVGKSIVNINEKRRIYVSVRRKYPMRKWNSRFPIDQECGLPEGSYYAIRDSITNEVYYKGNSIATGISFNGDHYFDWYTNGFVPNRYYKFDIILPTGEILQSKNNIYLRG